MGDAPLFVWHEGMRAVIWLDPADPRRHNVALHTDALRHLGFTGLDGDYRRELMRVDPPEIPVMTRSLVPADLRATGR